MSRRIEEDEIAVGIWLRLCPRGAERQRSTLGTFKFVDIEINVLLFGHRSRRPRGNCVVLDPRRGQQEMVELDYRNLLCDENDLLTKQLGPEVAQLSRIRTVQRNASHTYLRIRHVRKTTDWDPYALAAERALLRRSVRR